MNNTGNSSSGKKSWTSWTGLPTAKDKTSASAKDAKKHKGKQNVVFEASSTMTGEKNSNVSSVNKLLENDIDLMESSSVENAHTYSHFTIESATLEDKEVIFELINNSYKVEDGDSGIAFKKTPRLLTWDDSGLGEAYEKNRILVARSKEEGHNKEIIGCIVYYLEDDQDKKAKDKGIHFGPLAVSIDYQRKGVALCLIREIERIGLEHQCEYVEISVVNFRTDILPWYQRIGFEIVRDGEPFPDPERCTRECTFCILRMTLFQFSTLE